MDTIFHNEPQESFQKIITELLSYYYVPSFVPQSAEDTAVLKLAKEDIKKLIINSNFDIAKVPELLVDKDWDREKVAFFVNLLNEKKTELLYATLIKQNSEYGETITSFDWLLKLVLGTSELNTARYPLLQLILSTDNDGIQKRVAYDVNKDMLMKIINALENLD